ncbi:mRNA decay protein [Dimargaris verticillata]|uniref:mRNA decay protein n=1 Tax=Dimargaris verticillata TaxID=2761393 RepID=A0A9W8B5G6_9FUNG|nr:mRNA decay protein [Dimargaris verticillata]
MEGDGTPGPDEADQRLERQRALQQAILAAWIQPQASPANLDANLKKNTAFVKKCKASVGADMAPTLIKDIGTLKLEKYVGEVVTAIAEGGLIKCKTTADVDAAVDVIARLHQRFPDTFTVQFVPALHRQFSTPTKAQLNAQTPEQHDKTELSRLSRQRTLLRVAGELWLAGLFYGFDAQLPMVTAHAESMRTESSLLGGSSKIAAPSSAESLASEGSQMRQGIMTRIVSQLLYPDLDRHLNTPLALTLAKYLGYFLCGTSKEAFPALPSQSDRDLVAMLAAQRKPIASLLKSYYKSLCVELAKQHKRIQATKKAHQHRLVNRGMLPEADEQHLEQLTKELAKLLTNIESIAAAMDWGVPTLPEDDAADGPGISLGLTASAATSVNGRYGKYGQWDDEEAQHFYENLVDLKDVVPGVFLGGARKPRKPKAVEDPSTAPSTDNAIEPNDNAPSAISMESLDAQGGTSTDMSNLIANLELDDATQDLHIDTGDVLDSSHSLSRSQSQPNHLTAASTSLAEPAAGDTATAPVLTLAGNAMASNLNELLLLLPSLVSRDMVDQAAIQFCFFNSKQARQRLLEAVLAVPRTRLELIPHYARLVATLHQYMTDLGPPLTTTLHQRFRRQTLAPGRSAGAHGGVESRIRDVFLLVELAKFRVIPLHLPLYCLKTLIQDFSSHAIEILCRGLLEPAGAFLYHWPETRAVMTELLAMLKRKKEAKLLDRRLESMLDFAYHQCNPQRGNKRQPKLLTIKEQYVYHLVYERLGRSSVDAVAYQLRKLDWTDPLVSAALYRCFTKAWKVSYSLVGYMATLVASLAKYHPMLNATVVDAVLEGVRVGLEQNVFKHNQRRVAQVRYLGELYARRVVSAGLVFETLYTILTFGYTTMRPHPARVSPFDLPHDYFRVRLCCVLLDSCGLYLNRGRNQTKLAAFLAYFQLYLLAKDAPPIEVKFLLEDTFDRVCPGFQFGTDFAAASLAYDTLVAKEMAVTKQTLSSAPIPSQMVKTADASPRPTASLAPSPSAAPTLHPDALQGFDDGSEPVGSDASDTESTGSSASDSDDQNDHGAYLLEQQRLEQQRIVREQEEAAAAELAALKEAEDAHFNEIYRQIVAESLESRKSDQPKVAPLNIHIPLHLQTRSIDTAAEGDRAVAGHAVTPITTATAAAMGSHVAYTILSKKHNKPHTGQLHVPSQSKLVSHTISEQRASYEEKQQLKQFVLKYERQSHENYQTELQRTLANQGVRLVPSSSRSRRKG